MKELGQWVKDKKLQVGGSIVMSLAAVACGPKDTIKIVPAAEGTPQPPVAASKISAEKTQTPALSTPIPDIPGLHDRKGDPSTPTQTATATATGTSTPEPSSTAVQAPVEIAPTQVPTPNKTPTKTATPRPTATPTRTPEPAKTPAAIETKMNLEMTQSYINTINTLRRGQGLNELTVDARLQASVEKYTKLLFNFFKDNPTKIHFGQTAYHALDGDSWDRAIREGYPSNQVGEVGSIFTATSILSRTSAQEGADLANILPTVPDHRDIILGPHNFTNIAAACIQGPDPSHNNYGVMIVCLADLGHP